MELKKKDLKPNDIIMYDPITLIPYINGKGPNKTCGDCGKHNNLELYYESEFGRYNHGVCFSCYTIRNSEECI